MLSEFSLGPEVFCTDAYADAALAAVCLAQFRAPLLEDCLVRDLRTGAWHEYVRGQQQRLHPRGKELLVKLKTQRRLISYDPVLPDAPVTDEEWESEALAAHGQTPLTGLIFGQQAKTLRFAENPLVASPEILAGATFWAARACSKRIPRTIGEYRTLLNLALRHANWLAFIDPHLDPSNRTYREFHQLLDLCAQRNPMPLLEIHRVAWTGDARDKRECSAEHEKLFRQYLEPQLRHAGLRANVFLWDDFHDRFLASNLIGLSWSNGFDTTSNPASSVTVSRLSRSDRDDLQKEFSINSSKHDLKHKFTIGQ